MINKNTLENVYYTFLAEIVNIQDPMETFLIGKVEDFTIKSASIKGVFIEEHFGIVNLVDSSGDVEIMLDSEKLKQLKKMNLDEMVVFKVSIIDNDFFKKINVNDIMTINDAKELSK